MPGNTVYVQGSYVDVHDNDVVNLSIDKATVSMDVNDKQIKGATETLRQCSAGGQRNEEQFHFVHPEIDDEEAWHVHDAVKRVVAHQKVLDICLYLKDLKKNGKVLLPQSPSVAYQELKRMGMPTGDGFSEKYFASCYKD